MPRVVVFPADNQNHPQAVDTVASTGLATQKMLQQERDRVLQITNYLEALYARLLAESKGGAAITLITGETPFNRIQRASRWLLKRSDAQ